MKVESVSQNAPTRFADLKVGTVFYLFPERTIPYLKCFAGTSSSAYNSIPIGVTGGKDVLPDAAVWPAIEVKIIS